MRFLTLFIVLFSYPNLSLSYQCLDFFTTNVLEKTQDRKMTFAGAEVYRRNNQLGIQQVGKVEFEKWIEVGPYATEDTIYNFIGITKAGRLYHAIRWKGVRSVAWLMSGQREINRIFMLKNEVLVAVDKDSQVLIYSPSKWLTSPLKQNLKRGVAVWAAVTTAVSAVFTAIFPESLSMGFSDSSFIVPVLGISSVTAMNTAFVMLNRYERLNTFPDGFIETGIKYTNDQQLQSDLLTRYSQVDLQQFFASQHFLPPDLSTLDPALPEVATEPIH